MENNIIVAASVPGYSHIKNNIPNQDSYSYVEDKESGITVIVVSDGAGSSKNSKLGSGLCCDFLTGELLKATKQTISSKNPRMLNTKIIESIGKHLEYIASLPDGISSYHHTLSAVIFSPYGGKIIQIGDSPIIHIKKHNCSNNTFDSTILTDTNIYNEEKSEYANQTVFLTTHSDWFKYLRMYSFSSEDTSAILVMSDGAGSIFIDKPKNKIYSPAFMELLKRFREYEYLDLALKEFLSLKEIDSITGDDKTLVALFPRKWINKEIKYSAGYLNDNSGVGNFSEELTYKVEGLIEGNSNIIEDVKEYYLNRTIFNSSHIDEKLDNKAEDELLYKRDIKETNNNFVFRLCLCVLFFLQCIMCFLFYIKSARLSEDLNALNKKQEIILVNSELRELNSIFSRVNIYSESNNLCCQQLQMLKNK